MAAAKYVWGPVQSFLRATEYIWQNNPKKPWALAPRTRGGYILSGVEDKNLILKSWCNLVDGREVHLPRQNRLHFLLVSATAKRLPHSADLLGHSRFPQFLRWAPLNEVCSMRIITSPSVSTVMPELRIPT